MCRTEFTMKNLLVLLLILFANSAFSFEEHSLECKPEKGGNGFAASIKIKQSKTTWSGRVQDFKIKGDWEIPEGCKTPNIEVLDISGHLDKKFYYHKNEYQKGCIFRMVFLSTASAKAWVYHKENYSNGSNKLHANCKKTL